MITYEQLDAVIPRVPAGIDTGDLTDPEERPAFVAQVLGWVLRASTTAPVPERGSTGHTDPDPGVSVAWGVDSAEVTWPPPSPGTHESDLRYSGAIKLVARTDDPTNPKPSGRLDKYRIAAAWSRENAR